MPFIPRFLMRYLIVDGHSIIFQWPELRAMHGKRGGAARDELIRRLTQYQDATDIRVVAVFDGRSDKQNEATEPGGIQIFYSKVGQTADAIIERLCAKYAKQHDIVVATDDSMERQTAMTFGASAVSSEMLRTLLEDAEKDLHRRIEKHRRS
jgi:predicted RNA-binding protein with PIN domain